MSARRALSMRANALVILTAVALSGCGGSAASESAVASVATASPAASVAGGAAGEEQPFQPGRLEAGVRYVLDGPPRISFVPHEGTGAFPAAKGALLTFGETKVYIATAATDVYIGLGEQEPIGPDAASVMEAFERNERIAISDTGTMEINGTDVPYADFTLPYTANEEGGTPILSIDTSPLFLNDLTANRVILLEGSDGLAAVVVSVPEESDLEAAVESMAPLLDSIIVD